MRPFWRLGWSRPSDIWDMIVVVVGLLYNNIIIACNVQEYEMRTISKRGDFSETERFAYTKMPRALTSIVFYAPPSVEALGVRPTIPKVFKPCPTTTPVFKRCILSFR